MNTPDNTEVIRMRRDFEDFLSDGAGGVGPKFSLNRYHELNSSKETSGALSLKTLLEREKEERLKDAEILTAKSCIVKLETKVNNLTTSNKRARIEYEKDLEAVKSDREREIEKINDLKAQLEFLSRQEKHLKEDLSECQKELHQQKVSCDEKILTLQKDKWQLEEDLQQAQEHSWEKTTQLKNELLRNQTELQICRNELEETKAQLKLQLKRSADTTSQMKELEEYRLRSTQAEQKIKDLERELSQHDDDITVTRAMKCQLDKVPDLEKELRKLQEENNYFRETEKNAILLEEQIESLKKKLERAEQKTVDYIQLQFDNDDLKKRIQKWEAIESVSGSKKLQSPAELSRLAVDLQSSQALLLEKQGQIQTRLNTSEEQVRQMTEKYKTSANQLAGEQNRVQQQSDLIKRLQRKLLLVTKEREGYKRVLDSYESEVTVNLATHASSRIQQLEELVQGYRRQAEVLENELGKSAEEVTKTKSMYMQMESRVGTDASCESEHSKADQDKIRELREKVMMLETELEKKEQEKCILESIMEQRHLQGDYDPTKTKVVHFTVNPAAVAQQQRGDELERVKEENKKLKQRLKILEKSGGQVEDLTVRVEENLQQPDASKMMEDMKAQLTREELRNKRLIEAFKKTSHEFREVCYQLTGYKIDIPCSNQYRLTSMFAESAEDYLLFLQSPSGEVQMLQTGFSETVKDLIEIYLTKQDSIPAFLSSVTLELFSRQTMNLG